MQTPFFNMDSPRVGVKVGTATSVPPAIISPIRSHKLPEGVRLERLAICAVCEFNHHGFCLKCEHCNGRNIASKVRAIFEFCPLKPAKWGPHKFK